MRKVLTPALKTALYIFWLAALGLFSPRASAEGAAPSEQECVDFARQIEQSLTTNTTFLLQSFDWNEILCRGITNFNAPKDIETNFFKSFVKSAEVTEFTKLFNKTNYKFLRILSVDDTPRPLFRLTKPDGSVHYHQLVIEQFTNGPKIVDLYFLTDGKPLLWHPGELFSETARRVFLPTFAIAKRGFFARLMGDKDERLKYVSEKMEFTKLVQAKNFKGAIKVYEKLPLTVQNERDMLVMRVLGALLADDKEGQDAALKIWEETFPRDPALELAIADAALRKKNYAVVIESLERLDEALGGDAYLDLIKVTHFETLNDPERALDFARRAATRDPGSLRVQAVFLNCLLQMEKFSEIGEKLVSMHMNMNEDGTKLISRHPKYSKFAQSEGFNRWNQYRNPTKYVAPAPTVALNPGRPQQGKIPPGKAVYGKPIPKPVETLKLQGITIRGNRSSALINGATVFVGEEIELFTITKIEPDKVTLQSRNGQEKVLSLKEIFTR